MAANDGINKITVEKTVIFSSKKNETVDGSIDQGWAWIILIGITFWNTLVAGTLKSFGIFYLEYLELYQRGSVATAWIGFTFSFIITIMAPFAGYLGDRISFKYQRMLVMCLSVVIATAMAATGWMPNLQGAIFTYGAAGFAVSLADAMILGLIGKYFKRRRFLASGIVFAGSSLGTLIIPPLITVLVRKYAIRGAMVLFGGIWLNVMVVGAIIRPVEYGRETCQETSGLKAAYEEGTESPQRDDVEVKSNAGENVQGLQLLHLSHIDLSSVRSRQSLDTVCTVKRLRKPGYSESAPSLPVLFHNNNVMCSTRSKMQSSHTGLVHPDETYLDAGTREERTVDTCGEDTNRDDAFDAESVPSTRRRRNVLYQYWLFLMTPGLSVLIITFCVASFAYFGHFFVFPSLALELGMSKLQGALLVSVSNVTELLSRLIVGLLVDRGRIRKSHLIRASFVLSAAFGVAVSLFSSHALLFVYSALFGLIGGVFVPLAIPLMTELASASLASSAAGIFVVVTGTGISLGPPVLGAVKAITGSSVYSLPLCSLFYGTALGFSFLNDRQLSSCTRCSRKANHDPRLVADFHNK